MIHIIKNTPEHLIFKKDSRQETWFNNDCSDDNLLKQCKRESDTIKRIKFEDGEHIASLLNVYFNHP